MPMSFEQITTIVNKHGGVKSLALIINDAGYTINMKGINTNLISINQDTNSLSYPAYCNEIEEMVTSYISLDSIANVWMAGRELIKPVGPNENADGTWNRTPGVLDSNILEHQGRAGDPGVVDENQDSSLHENADEIVTKTV